VSDTTNLDINGRKLPVRFIHNRRARRIILRVDTEADGALVTLPLRASQDEAIKLVRAKADWLLKRLDKRPPNINFEPGSVIPVRGQDCVIVHDPVGRFGVNQSDGRICVSGTTPHIPRRVSDWLRKEAKQLLGESAHAMAAKVDRQVNRITVRNTKSRWGSCSAAGNLSFCWRLVMAPDWVIDYVVAHEVAHLVHMNHGPDFWTTVDGFGVDAKAARAWLNQNAERLHRIG
jgi:predicted metal-dependent hydrolase